MAKPKKELLVPFEVDTGNLVESTLYYYIDEPIEIEKVYSYYNRKCIFKPNFEFTDSLVYVRGNFGRSSRSVIVKSESTNVEYNMFWNYFDECLKSGVYPFTGKFTFVKKGSCFSIKPVGVK